MDQDLQELLSLLRRLQRSLQDEKKADFSRRVPFGDLVTDRWENAARYGFGEGTSCYDNVLVIGDVSVGRRTWIGPNVILDGQGGLEIGDDCQILAGAQLYSHSTLRRCLSKEQSGMDVARTRIGNGVYIAPNTVVQMGVEIGDGAVIGAMSFVRSNIPAGMAAWGCPARVQMETQKLLGAARTE